MVHSRTTAQGSKPCLITHSRANLALTLTKLVLRTKDLIFMLLDGLEIFLGVCGMSSSSSKLQMAGVMRIYRPPSIVAIAPTRLVVPVAIVVEYSCSRLEMPCLNRG